MADIRDRIIKEAKAVDGFLATLKYPVTKDEVYDAAQRRGFDENLLAQIDALTEEEYTDPTELSEAIGEVEVL